MIFNSGRAMRRIAHDHDISYYYQPRPAGDALVGGVVAALSNSATGGAAAGAAVAAWWWYYVVVLAVDVVDG